MSAEAVLQAAVDRDPNNVDLMSGIARMLLQVRIGCRTTVSSSSHPPKAGNVQRAQKIFHQVEEKITESQRGANVEPCLHDLLMMNRYDAVS